VELRESASGEAEKIVKAALAEADAIRAKARREGYDDGRSAADAELSKRVKDQLVSLKRVLEEIEAAREGMFAETESDMTELILSVVKKIINLARESDDTIFRCFIKTAIEKMKPQGKLLIRVSEEDFDTYFPSGSCAFTLDSGSIVTATVARDVNMGAWDCVLDDGDLSVNAGLDSQLMRVRLAFERAGGDDD
jgi:flagellar biosynthesis/type III secretory pathway protein FliH